MVSLKIKQQEKQGKEKKRKEQRTKKRKIEQFTRIEDGALSSNISDNLSLRIDNKTRRNKKSLEISTSTLELNFTRKRDS